VLALAPLGTYRPAERFSRSAPNSRDGLYWVFKAKPATLKTEHCGTKTALQGLFGRPKKKKNGFLKNEAGELLKTKDQPKKRTENEAETKLSILLKTKEGPKKRTENEPEDEVGHVIESK